LLGHGAQEQLSESAQAPGAEEETIWPELTNSRNDFPRHRHAFTDDRSALHTKFTDRARAVADLYSEMTADPSRRVLVVASTHEEIGRVTRAIRNDLLERGHLGQSVTLDRYVSLQWTEALKRDLSNYSEGHVLLVHRAARGMDKHEALTVGSVGSEAIVARNARGEEKTFTPSQTRSFSVHEQKSIDIAAGDRLLLTGNRRDADFRATNGELVRVRAVENGRIQLEDGRTLPANSREFDHGYAITAHRSQGKTVDGVILSADAMRQELFYVGASRGRSEIAIVTSDREQVRESLGISPARPSAMELAREQSSSLGPEHGIQHCTYPKHRTAGPAPRNQHQSRYWPEPLVGARQCQFTNCTHHGYNEARE
jgi:ATP-dependent exoDNAse (exonuclease V) alpha subunit